MSLRGWCSIGLVVDRCFAVSGCGGQGAECSCSTAEAKVEQPALSSPVASVNADGPAWPAPRRARMVASTSTSR